MHPSLPRSRLCSKLVTATTKLKIGTYGASDKMVANESVESSGLVGVQGKAGGRPVAYLVARLIAAAWNLLTKTTPSNLEFNSPVRPLLKLTSRILPLSMISHKLEMRSLFGNNITHHLIWKRCPRTYSRTIQRLHRTHWNAGTGAFLLPELL